MRTRFVPSRRIAGALTVSALALGSTLAAGALSPAAAADPIPQGSLSGKVVDANGVAIPGASVWAYGDIDDDDDYGDDTDWFAYQATGLAGEFVLANLPAAEYKIEFSAPGYIGEAYLDVDDLDAATPVVVGTGNVALSTVSLATQTYRVTVDEETDVTGLVTDAATGKPIADANVSVYDAVTGDHIDGASTDVTGRYAFDDLEGHGSVKLEFYTDGAGGRLGHRPAWSGGARTKEAAAAVAITPGTAVTVSSALTQYAGITGRVLNPSGVAPFGGWVTAYDADSSYASDASVRADGTYYLGGLNPGEEYRISFSGYDYPGNDWDAETNYYYDVWYTDGNNFASATPLKVASGSWTPDVSVSLRDTLVALEQPSISGNFVVGKTLTGNKGRWNRNGNSTFSYEWLRGSTVVGTASTYKLTAADAGQSIALRVTNTNFDNGKQRTVSATTSAKVAKFGAKFAAKAKKVKKGKKAGATKVTIRVKAKGQAAKAITGKVKVTEGKKKVAKAKVKNGKATFLVKTKPGKHTYAVKYNGNKTTLAAKGKVKVKVKK